MNFMIINDLSFLVNHRLLKGRTHTQPVRTIRMQAVRRKYSGNVLVQGTTDTTYINLTIGSCCFFHLFELPKQLKYTNYHQTSPNHVFLKVLLSKQVLCSRSNTLPTHTIFHILQRRRSTRLLWWLHTRPSTLASMEAPPLFHRNQRAPQKPVPRKQTQTNETVFVFFFAGLLAHLGERSFLNQDCWGFAFGSFWAPSAFDFLTATVLYWGGPINISHFHGLSSSDNKSVIVPTCNCP